MKINIISLLTNKSSIKLNNLIIIIILAIMSFFISNSISNSNSSYYKNRINEFKTENEKLKEKRDSLELVIIELDKKYYETVKIDSLIKIELKNISSEINISEKNSKVSINNYLKIKNKINLIVESLDSTNNKKTNEELIESFKRRLYKD